MRRMRGSKGHEAKLDIGGWRPFHLGRIDSGVPSAARIKDS